MARRPAPSLPTPKQIAEVAAAVAELHPGARIARVGPEGVTFEYPGVAAPAVEDWQGRPFTADGA